MSDNEISWIYVNRFGWFYDLDAQELSWREAREAYLKKEKIFYLAPARDSEPRVLNQDFDIEALEQVCRTHESKWAH